MLAPKFDLQSHSKYSDGQLPPAEVVRAAAQAGVELLALSDHDSVEGVAEAQSAALEVGIDLVPAVELLRRGARLRGLPRAGLPDRRS